MDSTGFGSYLKMRVRLFGIALLLVMLAGGGSMPLPAAASTHYDKNRGSILLQNSLLLQREAMVSPNAAFFVTTLSDGNLCVQHHSTGAGIWCSRDTVAPGSNFRTSVQSDGNVCTAGTEGVAWCARNQVQSGGPFFLALQDDANLCMYKGAPGNITGTVWCSMGLARPLPHGSPLVYGSTYHIKNDYSGAPGTFLDSAYSGCQGNWMCISTARSNSRDQRSGSWVLLSAQGKAAGEPVMEGDLVHLANLYPLNYGSSPLISYVFGGFLDTRGSGCQGNALCVSTSPGTHRDGGSGTWKIESSSDRINSEQGVRLRNQYNGTYLDTRGSGCGYNVLCVSTSTSPNRDSGSGSWRFETANDVSDVIALANLRYYVETFSPRVRLHPEDPYLPESADYYLSKSAVYAANIADEGSASGISQRLFWYSSDRVAQYGVASTESYLRDFFAKNMPGPTKIWLSPDKDKEQVKLGSLDRAKTYITVNKSDNVFTIKYWYFFGYNGAGRVEGCSSSSVCVKKQASSYGRHDGDWERAELDVTESGTILAVRLSRHGDLVPVQIEDWDGSHPVIYSAFYSHALYAGRGTQYYQRWASKDWFLGTASIDLFDRTDNGGRTFEITSENSYELVRVTGMKDASQGITGVAIEPRALFKFKGRWGRYEHIRESIDLPFYSITLFEEIGAGPTTPDFN